jgi:hypothetical protein
MRLGITEHKKSDFALEGVQATFPAWFLARQIFCLEDFAKEW